MGKSRHKPSRRGRQPGQRPQRPVDPILAAAQVDAPKAKPIDDGFTDGGERSAQDGGVKT